MRRRRRRWRRRTRRYMGQAMTLAARPSLPREAVIDTNVQRTADLPNVVHLRFHTVLDDWGMLSRGRIGARFCSQPSC
eukprot:9502484-Pyramimonas_sp.AAC.1